MSEQIIGRFVPVPERNGRHAFDVVTKVDAPDWGDGDKCCEGTKSDGSNYHVILKHWRFDPVATPRIAAHEFLERGVSHMRGRVVQRDSEAGERSMARAVAAFNAQEGTNLTEAQGWRFMIQLKYARAVNGVFVADDYDDMAAYAGLAGEAAQ